MKKIVKWLKGFILRFLFVFFGGPVAIIVASLILVGITILAIGWIFIGNEDFDWLKEETPKLMV